MLAHISDRRTRGLLPALALILAGLLGACGLTRPPSAPASPTATPPPPVGQVVLTDQGRYTDLTAAELKAMMDHKDFFLVDVHVPHEGQMPRLDARIPYDEIASHLDQLPTDKGAKIVLICKSGGMSTAAARTLVGLGYTHVYNLAGGFNAWRARGYPFTAEP